MQSATVLLLRDGHVLAVSRGDDLDDWGMPGGHVEPGETPAETAARELLEETGAEVDPADLMLVYRQGGCSTFVSRQPVWVPRGRGEIVWESPEGVAAWIPVEALACESCTFGQANARMLVDLGLV
jgi:8-oxo-dGTP pyrophosphatase MutT (NUDIX family)